MQPDIYLFLLRHGGGIALRPYVEPDHDRVRGGGQQHVRFGNGADAGVEHAHLNLVVRELLQRLGEYFGGTAHVGLDDERQFLDFARFHLLVKLLEGQAAVLGQRRFPQP